MGIPKRIKAISGWHSLVDGIRFQLPVRCIPSPVLMAVFPIHPQGKGPAARRGASFPHRDHGLLAITVINYLGTGIACTQGRDSLKGVWPGCWCSQSRAGCAV